MSFKMCLLRRGGWCTPTLELRNGRPPFAHYAHLLVLAPNSELDLYTLLLPTPSEDESSTTVTVIAVSSGDSTPFPTTMPQTAESLILLWSQDLAHVYAGVDTSQLEEVKIGVKTPSPRIGEVKAPEGFEVRHSQGSTLVSFVVRGSVADLVGPQVSTICPK